MPTAREDVKLAVPFEVPVRPLPAALKEIAGVVAASRLEHPPAEMVSCGVAPVDALTGGLPRGALTEIYGAVSSGRTSLMMSAMAAATAREELCALIDTTDCFDAQSAEAAGVDLDRLLWVRCNGERSSLSSREKTGHPTDDGFTPTTGGEECGTRAKRILQAKQQSGAIMPATKVWYGRAPARAERASENANRVSARTEADSRPGARGGDSPLQSIRPSLRESWGTSERREWARPVEQALKVADLLLQSGGFGMVVIDLGDVPAEIARRVPLTSWFRFRRAVENTRTVLLTIAQESCAKTCASLVLRTVVNPQWAAISEEKKSSHARVFAGIESSAEVVRSRVDAPEARVGKKPPRGVRADFASQTEWATRFM